MRTPEVTREFRDKCVELARISNVPQVKLRLLRLAVRYDRYLEEFDLAQSAAGDTTITHVLAGSSAGLVHGIEPAADIVRRIVAEAEAILMRRPGELLQGETP